NADEKLLNPRRTRRGTKKGHKEATKPGKGPLPDLPFLSFLASLWSFFVSLRVLCGFQFPSHRRSSAVPFGKSVASPESASPLHRHFLRRRNQESRRVW